jgi:hypothetical protein
MSSTTTEPPVLHAQVDAGPQVLAGSRRLDALDVLERAAFAVAHHALGARFAAEPLVEREFEAFLAHVIDVGEAEQVPGHFAGRVVTTVFAQGVDTGDAERLHLLGVGRAHVAYEVDELAVEVAGDAPCEPVLVAVEHLRKLGEVLRVLRQLARVGPDRIDRRADREWLAIAVEHHAAVGRQLHVAQDAGVPLSREEVLVNDLQVNRARQQRNTAQRQQRADEPQAPAADLGRGSVAGVVVANRGAAFHGCTMRSSVACGVTMPRSSCATCSTRPCVAHVLCSSCSWPHSMSRSSRWVVSFCNSLKRLRASCLP